MEEIERRHILRVLSAVGGNKTTAAEILGFDRRTLYRKLERYGDLVETRESREPREHRDIGRELRELREHRDLTEP